MGVFVRWLKFILIDVHLIVVAVLAAFGAVVALLFMFVQGVIFFTEIAEKHSIDDEKALKCQFRQKQACTAFTACLRGIAC